MLSAQVVYCVYLLTLLINISKNKLRGTLYVRITVEFFENSERQNIHYIN